MHLYGTTREDFAEVAMAIRANAVTNPNATLRKPMTLLELLRRPEVDLAALQQAFGSPVEGEGEGFDAAFVAEVRDRVEIAVKYEGYIHRQVEEAERFRRLEDERLPDSIDYGRVPGLSREVQEKLGRVRPRSLGQAARISGVTPAAVSILLVHARSQRGKSGSCESLESERR
mgnify:CR=1 FL=1